MMLEQLSQRANQDLIHYLDAHLADSPREFRDDVLYAVRISAPLRERMYLVRVAADLADADWETVDPFAFAAELFIVSALTADDVIDGAERRSGEPSLCRCKGPARSFLVAEWLHTIATACLWPKMTSVSSATWRRAAQEFQESFRLFFVNQYLTSSLEHNPNVGIEVLDELARGRTGRLLEACLTAPAIAAAPDETAMALAECGRWLGIAFQHRDDILDFIGASEVLGKPILLDLLNGQPNLVLCHAFTITHDQTRRDMLLRHFGAAGTYPDARKRGPDLQEEIVSALRTSGSLLFAARVVQDYCNRAIQSLGALAPSSAKQELEDFVRVVGTIQFPWESAL